MNRSFFVHNLIKTYSHLAELDMPVLLKSNCKRERGERMNKSFISQDGTVFNYTNAVSHVACGEYEDESGYGFMAYLNSDTENGIVIAEYDNAEKFSAVRNDFSKWLGDENNAVFEFPS